MKLVRAPSPKEARRPGWGLPKVTTTEGWTADFGAQKLVFFDLDRNGSIDGDGRDGIGLENGVFVVAFKNPILLAKGQGELKVDVPAATATFSAVDLGQSPAFVSQAAHVNDVRLRAGLPMVVVDRDRSEACIKHCDFLKTNGLEAAWRGGMVHFENKKLPGYTQDGERAGWGSAIHTSQTDYRNAIDDWAQTVWHSLAMIDPRLERFGAALRHGVAMFYAAIEAGPELSEPFVYPSEGSRDVPRLFAAGGEVPAPFADDPRAGSGSGHPIIVLLPPAWRDSRIKSFTVTDEREKAVEGRIASPSAPGNPKKAPRNSGCAFFLPTKALSPNRTFAVRFEVEGRPALSWRFSTASK